MFYLVTGRVVKESDGSLVDFKVIVQANSATQAKRLVWESYNRNAEIISAVLITKEA